MTSNNRVATALLAGVLLASVATAVLFSARRDAPANVKTAIRSEHAVLVSARYPLHVWSRIGQIPVQDAEGGGIESFGDNYLVANGAGELFIVTRADSGIAAPARLRIPINVSDFRGARDSGGRHTNTFRVTDILVDERTAGMVRLFAAYHHWNSADRCHVMRVSMIEGHSATLLDAPGAWQPVADTRPCLTLGDSPFSGHESGGRLQLLDDRTLLLSVGDYAVDGINDVNSLAQARDTTYGKILSIDIATGRITTYSMGHRNPQGLLVTRAGDVWSTEHGPRGGDELNYIIRGRNYGWPRATLGTEYNAYVWPLDESSGRHVSFEPPAFAWSPAIGPSNLVEVRTDRFELWQGDLLLGSLTANSLFRVRLTGRRPLLIEEIPVGVEVRDLAIGRDGTVALWTDVDGRITLVEPEEGPLTGEALFRARCGACHVVDDGTEHRIGPDLSGFMSRPAATAAGFRYSVAMSSLGKVWTEERLTALLRAPQGFLPGTSMRGVVNDSAARRNLVTYLLTLK